MPVRLRLQRHGRKQRPFYYIVAADSRARRDGKYIERIGSYDPTTVPASIKLDDDAAFTWLNKGAEPTPTVRAILSYHGVLYRKHVQRGVSKGAFSQEEADKLYEAFIEKRKADINAHAETVGRNSAEAKAQREAAEAAKRAEKVAAAAAVLAEAAAKEAAENEAAEAEAAPAEDVAEAPATEETTDAPAEEVAEAPAAEEAPAETPAEEVAEAPAKEETPAEAPAKEEAPAEEVAEAPAKEEAPADAPAEDDKKEEA